MITPLDVAITQLGVREATGRNDGEPAARYMRDDELPWCAAFVLYCFEVSDAGPLHESTAQYYMLRNVDNFETEMKRRGLWFGSGLPPLPGDIIFFYTRSGSDFGSGRHMGLVEECDGQTVFTIEGNTSNMVQRRRYARTDRAISGYARPTAGDG